MEYLQVFNNKKELLNEKIERNKKFELKDDKYFMIILIFIENSKKEFLIQKTSKEKDSCMATTGGHVTFGDDGAITVLKEVEEELGLILKKEEINIVDTLKYDNCHVEIYYTKKDIDINSITLQESEVEYVNWYSEEEIMEFIENNEFRKSNIKPFEVILEYRKNMK